MNLPIANYRVFQRITPLVMSKRRSPRPGGKRNSRRQRRGRLEEETDCFSDDLDLEVARRLQSLHFSSLSKYEVFLGFSDDQLERSTGCGGVASSCSEVPGSPTRFSKLGSRRKRNSRRLSRKGRKKKKMDPTDCMEFADSLGGKIEMPEKAGDPWLKAHRFNPLKKGKQRVPASSSKLARGVGGLHLTVNESLFHPKQGAFATGHHLDRSIRSRLQHNMCSSDTSDIEDGTRYTSRPDEEMEDDLPVNGVVEVYQSSVAMATCHGNHTESESELSETADERGRDGDDEESSFEHTRRVPFWWEEETMSSGSDDVLPDADLQMSSILRGIQPVMRKRSWRSFRRAVSEAEKMHSRRKSSMDSAKRGLQSSSRRPSHSKSYYLFPEEIDQEVRRLVESPTLEELPLPLMSKKNCHLVREIAELYGVVCSVLGEKHTSIQALLLHKTADSRLANCEDVKRILDRCSLPSKSVCVGVCLDVGGCVV